MENAIVAICSVSATLIAVWGTILYPRGKERRRLKADQVKRQNERDQVIDGIPAVHGMTDGVAPMAVRLERVEQSMTNVVDGQALLEKRMDEANGTGKRTENMVKELKAQFETIVAHLGVAER